jgi:large exoprotein involved in heme utilization and adhesion
LTIDGSSQPTLDLRAGIDWEALLGFLPGNFTLGLDVNPETFGGNATSADILVGFIEINSPDGLVFLSNQYFPNQDLAEGDIFIGGGIDAEGFDGDGSNVVIDSRGSIEFSPLLREGLINTSSFTNNAGDIEFIAQNEIIISGLSTDEPANIISNAGILAPGNTGEISITARSLTFQNGQISNTGFGTGDISKITINITDDINLINAGILSTIGPGGNGNSEGISISANSLNMLGTSTLLSIIRDAFLTLPAGQGNAGDINVDIEGDILIRGVSSGETEDGRIIINPAIATSLAPGAEGSAGNINISADRLTLTEFSSFRSAIDLGAEGQAGNITLRINNLELNSSQIISASEGIGDAGNISIFAEEQISLDNGSFITGGILFGAEGNASQIEIDAGSLSILSGSIISTAVLGSSADVSAGVGNSGNINITVEDFLLLEGQLDGVDSQISSTLGRDTEGNGGSINIQANALAINNDARIDSSTRSDGDAGNIFIASNDLIISNDGGIETGTLSRGNAGNVQIVTNILEITGGGYVLTDSLENSAGNGGDISIDSRSSVEISGVSLAEFDDSGVADASGLFAQTRAFGRAGDISLSTDQLVVRDGGAISTETDGVGDGGNLTIIADEVLVSGGSPDQSFSSSINASAESDSVGSAGDVNIVTRQLIAKDGGFVASSAGVNSFGNAGNVIIEASELIELRGRTLDGDNSAGISVAVADGGRGNSGDLSISTGNLFLIDGGRLLAQNFGRGEGGSINASVSNLTRILSGNGGISLINATVGPDASGQPSNISLDTQRLELLDGGQIVTNTFGGVDAGNILISATESVDVRGFSQDGNFSSGIFARSLFSFEESTDQFGNVEFLISEATGGGGTIEIGSNVLNINDRGEIGTDSFGPADAGNLVINLDSLTLENGNISTTSAQGSGGNITVNADEIILFGDSNISTFVPLGAGGGGNIAITADFVIALDDSDILAFSADGRGGNIDLSQTTFFGQNPNIASGTLSREALLELDGNNRVDINATGGVASGQIFINDSSFVENSLTNLEDAIIDTAALTSGSCIARTEEEQGSFVITGRDGIPPRPGDIGIAAYPTGTVRTLAEPTATLQEPDGVYQLPDGRLVLSRECD